MIQKTFSAFGHFVIRNDISVGEVINDGDFQDGVFTADENYASVWVYSKGLIKNVEVNTGEERLRPAGYNNLDSPEPVGTWRASVIEPTVVFCLPPTGVNVTRPPLIRQLRYFHLGAGQSTTLAQWAKLSLFDGKLQVGDVVVGGMRQVHVKSGDKVATAVEDCYGVFFP